MEPKNESNKKHIKDGRKLLGIFADTSDEHYSSGHTEDDIPKESPAERRERIRQEARDLRIKRLALGAIGTALGGLMITVAAVGAMGGESPKLPDEVTAFKTFTIGPNTNMRSSRSVGKGEDNNRYASLDETITLTAKRFATDEVDANGEWYEVPVSNITAEDPDFTLRTESGIPVRNGGTKTVYINEQGVQAVPDLESTETTPTK